MRRIYNVKYLKQLRRNLRNDMTKPEQVLWYYLRRRQIQGIKFRRQCSIGPYIVDFYSFEKKLVIEVDGDNHYVSIHAIQKDKERTQYLESFGNKVIRFTNTDVMKNIEGCIDELLVVLDNLGDYKK